MSFQKFSKFNLKSSVRDNLGQILLNRFLQNYLVDHANRDSLLIKFIPKPYFVT